MLIASVVGVGGIWQSCKLTLATSERTQLQRLASIVAASVPASEHAVLAGASGDVDAARTEMVARLGTMHGTMWQTRRLYTYIAERGSVRIVFDTSAVADGTLVANPPTPMRLAISDAGRALGSIEPWEMGFGRVISGFAPIYDASGEVAGGVGIDVDAFYLDQQRADAGRAAFLGLVPCIVASLGFGVLVYRQRTKELHDRARVEAAQRAAEAANSAKSDFLASMSHEIRTPMTVVIGYAELLEDEDVPLEARRQYVQNIQRSGQHLIELINDILDLAKIESGKIELQLTPCDPAAVLKEVEAIMRQRADAKGLKLELAGHDTLPRSITTDAMRLRQILLNLVGNALKFTPKGAVTVTASFREDSLGGRLEVAVADTGVGIEREAIGRLFKPFTQVDGSTTRRFGGTGLGLAISRRFATMLGGGIDVQSTPGAGSTFTVWVDAGAHSPAPVDAKELPAPTPAAQTPTLKGRILLADDGIDNQRLISLILRNAGAEVDVVGTGAELVRAAAQGIAAGRPHQLVLTDMQMPELDGYGATTRLREMGVRVPIVALTAHAMSEQRERCFEVGCTDVLTKPFNRQELVARCADWLAAGASIEDAPAAAR